MFNFIYIKILDIGVLTQKSMCINSPSIKRRRSMAKKFSFKYQDINKAKKMVIMVSTIAILNSLYWWIPFPGSPNMLDVQDIYL